MHTVKIALYAEFMKKIFTFIPYWFRHKIILTFNFELFIYLNLNPPPFFLVALNICMKRYTSKKKKFWIMGLKIKAKITHKKKEKSQSTHIL